MLRDILSVKALRCIRSLIDERSVRLIFHVSLWLKSAFALLEIVGGITAFAMSQKFLVKLASAVTQGELTEDPRDFIANILLRSAQTLSVSAQHFTAFYLCSHGVIKLWLIIGLLRRRLWYYPTAMVVFDLFILYQLYRFAFTHSLMLLLITVIDAVVIVLAWHEYRFLRRDIPPLG
jgi:uncharacterized membrane protein